MIVNRRYSKYSASVQRQFADHPDYYLQVPCGRCSLCKQRIAREWKIRLHYEMQCTREHRHNSQMIPRVVFLTFTISDDYYTNSEKIFSDWLVKFRDNFRKRYGKSPRYWAITDRGSQFARLHLHMLLFDPRKYDRRRNEYVGDISISELKKHSFWWPYGFVDVQWIKWRGVDQYVVGYLTGANLEREEPVKHGKPICQEALKYKPHIYPSKGLGAAILDSSFVRYVCSRDFATLDLNGFVYGLPRYYLEKVLDHLGRVNDDPTAYYTTTSISGKKVVVNEVKRDILLHRKALNDLENLDYVRSLGFNESLVKFEYRRKSLSSTSLASVLSETSRFVTPKEERHLDTVLSSAHSDFPEVFPEYVEPMGLRYKYYPYYELHYDGFHPKPPF